MIKNDKITTLIFDFGGVIINLDLFDCIKNLKKLGAYDIESYLSNFGQKGFFKQYERGLINTNQFIMQIRELSKADVTDDEIVHAWCSFLCDIPNERFVLLDKLKKKYKLLLLSNSNPLHVEVSAAKEFAKVGKSIRNAFDSCYFSYEMGLVKPDAAMFEALLADAGLTARECLFLDDGSKNIEMAASLGFQTYLVTQGENLDFLLDLK